MTAAVWACGEQPECIRDPQQFVLRFPGSLGDNRPHDEGTGMEGGQATAVPDGTRGPGAAPHEGRRRLVLLGYKCPEEHPCVWFCDLARVCACLVGNAASEPTR